ncbi:MAG: amylo-alpha-1,6-glucosidase, partial [Nanoarchaeota archaeon]
MILMTKRIYSHDRFKHVSTGPPAGLLTDGNGGYFAIHPDLSFRGWFRFDRSDWDMQKILDSITPLDEGECIATRQMFYGLKREFSSGARDAFHLYGRSLLYECFDFNGRVKLSLDHRKAYEGSRFGRHYEIDVYGSTVRITFLQHSEDGSVEYESHLIIRGARDAEVLGQWRKEEYVVDRDRGARSEYWVYDALTFIPSRHVIFSSSSTDYEARTVVDVAYHHSEEIISTLHTKALHRLPDVSSFGDRKTQAALLCASDSLLSLTQNILDGPHDVEKGIFAGLPWFFQIWSRDELISLGGLIALASVNDDDALWSDCISIVDRHMSSLLDDGLLPNRHPESKLPSADAIGWLAHRTNVLIDNLRKHKKLFEFCSVDMLVSWHSTLSHAISLIKEHHGGTGQFSRSRSGSHACLFSNGAGQTWMDTIVEGDDGRPGFRIEIQALMLSLYDAVLSLSRLLSFEDVSGLSDERNLFVSLVRSHFVQKGYCCHVIDGLSFGGDIDD